MPERLQFRLFIVNLHAERQRNKKKYKFFVTNRCPRRYIRKSMLEMSKNFLILAYRKLQQSLRYGLSHTEEDALNDAFCQLWVGKYSPASKEEGERLLYSTLRRRQISLWRSENRHPKIPPSRVQIAEPPPETDAEETYQRIKELIKTELTPLQQDILTRHDINDETYSEIAERLGMQEAAVRMQLSRARKTIREIYKKTKK